MSSLIEKIKGMVSVDDPYSEFEDGEETPVEVAQEEAPAVPVKESIIEVKVVRPETFANITEIADYLLDNCTVVLNLELTNNEDAKRMLDFLAGVAYSVSGQLKSVANNTYVITPCNVDVTDTQVRSAEPQQNPAHQATTTGLTSDTLF